MTPLRCRYRTDLTDARWRILEPLIPAPKPGGRPPVHQRRELLNAMLYWLRAGCVWRLLPHDLPPWQTVYHYFRCWRLEGRWERGLLHPDRDPGESQCAPAWVLLDRGRFTRIDVPGALQAQAFGVNNLGQVVGESLDATGGFHGFVWRKGRFVPGATSTSLTEINDRGELLGVRGDPAGACTAGCSARIA